ADRHGLSVLCVRIGAVVAEDRPLTPRHFSVWCSQRDVAQVLDKCVTAPSQLRYDIFYAVSNNRRNYRDFAHARAVLGHEPRDSGAFCAPWGLTRFPLHDPAAISGFTGLPPPERSDPRHPLLAPL